MAEAHPASMCLGWLVRRDSKWIGHSGLKKNSKRAPASIKSRQQQCGWSCPTLDSQPSLRHVMFDTDFDLLLMSVKSKKLRGVTFYLHHMDVQLKGKKKKKKNPKVSDLHASCIQTLARIHQCCHDDAGKILLQCISFTWDKCHIFRAHSGLASFPELGLSAQRWK